MCDNLHTQEAHKSRGRLTRAVERGPVPLRSALETIPAYPQLQQHTAWLPCFRVASSVHSQDVELSVVMAT